MYRRNIISGAVVLSFFIFMIIQGGSLSEQAAYWPKFVCTVGLVLSLGNILSSALALKKEGAEGKAEQEPLFPLTGTQIRNGLIVLVILAVWGYGIGNIGFLVTSVVCMSATFLIFMPEKDMKKRITNVIIAILVGAVFYFLFKQLGVHFPKTILM
ncbi:MAG: tripartite tricarboxylate transporter TctB family protein [Stomatobaculum sp.]|nr:tripartite tricarboxylate transporter TctB family protein [Stomatobaculum sp.]